MAVFIEEKQGGGPHGFMGVSVEVPRGLAGQCTSMSVHFLNKKKKLSFAIFIRFNLGVIKIYAIVCSSTQLLLFIIL